MSGNADRQVSVKPTFIGVAVGAVISILFTLTGNPGLIGVGAAIGASLAIVLNQRSDQHG